MGRLILKGGMGEGVCLNKMSDGGKTFGTAIFKGRFL